MTRSVGHGQPSAFAQQQAALIIQENNLAKARPEMAPIRLTMQRKMVDGGRCIPMTHVSDDRGRKI